MIGANQYLPGAPTLGTRPTAGDRSTLLPDTQWVGTEIADTFSAVAALDFASDAAAMAGGVPYGGFYHTSGALKVRLTGSEAAAVVAAMTTPPSSARRLLIDTMVTNLVAAGIWAKLGVFYVFAAHDSQAALLDWKAPTGTPALEVNNPTFTADRGYTGDGAAAYISTQRAWNGIAGVAQDDAHVGSYAAFGGTTSNFLVGLISGIDVRLGRASNMITRLHAAASVTSGSVPATAGTHLVASRAAAGGYDRYVDGVAVTASADASIAPVSNVLAGLRSSTSYAPSTCSIRALHAGAALTSGEVSTLRSQLQTYMAAIGAS